MDTIGSMAAVVLVVVVALWALTRANARQLREALDRAAAPALSPAPATLPLAWRRFGLDVDTVDGESRSLALWESAPEVVHIPPSAPAGWEVSRWTPTRAPTPASDLAVPLGQAFGLALAVGIGGGLIAWALGWSWRAVALAAGASLVLAVLWRLRIADGLLQVVETATGVTPNGAGAKPMTAFTLANPLQARAAVATETRLEADNAKRQALGAFVDKCFTLGCSESAHGIRASGPDRAAFVAQRDVLLALGVAAWRNPERPKAGWQMAVNHERARQIIARHVL